MQAPDPDLEPASTNRATRPEPLARQEKKTSEDAVAISPLPSHYHRRVQRGRRCHVEHPKNCLRKGKSANWPPPFVSVISPPPKSVGRVGLSLDCCSNVPPPLSLLLPVKRIVCALIKDREILRDQWKYGLETRDLRIEEYRRALAKQGK